MKSNQKNILLVTEEAVGHHIAFMALFAKSLVGLDCKVTVLMPQVTSLKEHLGGQTWVRDIHFEEYHNRFQGGAGLGRFSSAYTSLKRWIMLRRHTIGIQKKNSVAFDLVFLAFLDPYLSNYLPFQLVDLVFPFQWAGLYFHPKFLRYNPKEGTFKAGLSSIDYVLRSKRCIAIGTHDDKIMGLLNYRVDKPVVFFPEIADLTAPDVSHKLYKEIKERAAGRKVIGLVGCEHRKGFHLLVELAKDRPHDYFFVFAGAISPVGYTQEEVEALSSYLNKGQDHLFYYPHYLCEGVEINSFLAAMDIIYIVYNGFTSTSNFSTKAAFLKKPVLATELYIIGDETKDFHLGVTVKENNVDDLKRALRELESKLGNGELVFDTEGYLEKHNIKKLDFSFREILYHNK